MAGAGTHAAEGSMEALGGIELELSIHLYFLSSEHFD